MLARGSHNKDIKIWEVTTGTELMTLLGKDQYDHHWSVCVAFSPDGMHMASASDIGKIRLWEVLPSGEEKLLVNGHWREQEDDEQTESRGFFVEDDGGFQKAMETWIGALTYTPDGKFVIGPVPNLPNFLVAGGCCGSGVAASGGFGQSVAELINGSPTAIDIERYRPDRFGDVDPSSQEFRDRCAAARSSKSRG